MSELASLMENRQSQYQQSSKTTSSTVNRVSRNTSVVLSPRANPSVMRSIAIDSDTVLPTIVNSKNIINDQAPQKPRRATTLRAAESGKGSLLPLRGTPSSSLRPQQQQLPQRVQRKPPARSNSSGPSYSGALPRTRQDLGDAKSHPQKFLRQRNRNASSDDEFDSSSQRVRRNFSGSRRQRQGSGMSVSSMGSIGGNNNNSGSSKEHASSLGWGNGILCERQIIKISRMKLGHLLQVVIVLAVIALVYESHQKALFATQKLYEFKEEESLVLLHLKKIEEQNIILHKNFVRLAEVGIDNSGDSTSGRQEDKGVDTDLIHRQIDQLQNMEQEVTKEVQTLQKRIQRSARSHIIQEFGEGYVQVVLELDFGNAEANAGSNRISILLWHETPHAAWTWLEQIGNNVWDGASFKWQEGHIIDALPPREGIDPKRDGKIEFIEHPNKDEHMPWTVGLREHGSNGAISMYINLQDNSRLHGHETCVGKVIDGFDTLQNLLELSKSDEKGQILIRRATAEHYVTKKGGI